MKKMIIVLSLALFFAWGAPAKAEEGAFEKLGAACGQEIEALCSKVVLGQGRMLECLEKNQDKISPECNTARVNAKKQFESQAVAN